MFDVDRAHEQYSNNKKKPYRDFLRNTPSLSGLLNHTTRPALDSRYEVYPAALCEPAIHKNERVGAASAVGGARRCVPLTGGGRREEGG